MLKKITFFISFIFVFLALTTPSQGYYDIGPYIATFKAEEGTTDVRVKLDITYNILNEEKDSDFIFVGPYWVKDVEVIDELQQELKFRVDHLQQTKINWFFKNKVYNGRYRVIVNFTLKNVLNGNLKKNSFNQSWVGNFSVPVHQVEYRFIFPDTYTSKFFIVDPPNYQVDGNSVFVYQKNLYSKKFQVDFRPGIVEYRPNLFSTVYWFFKGADLFTIFQLIALIIIIISVILILRLIKSIRFKLLTRDSSSCSGCASCTSCEGCGGCASCGGCAG